MCVLEDILTLYGATWTCMDYMVLSFNPALQLGIALGFQIPLVVLVAFRGCPEIIAQGLLKVIFSACVNTATSGSTLFACSYQHHYQRQHFRANSHFTFCTQVQLLKEQDVKWEVVICIGCLFDWLH